MIVFTSPEYPAVCTASLHVAKFHPIKLLLIYYKWPGGLGARPVEVFNIKILNRQVKLIGIYLIR